MGDSINLNFRSICVWVVPWVKRKREFWDVNGRDIRVVVWGKASIQKEDERRKISNI